MSRDDIIRMAREAGYGDAMSDLHAPALERFAAIVAEHVFAGNFQHLIDLAARKEREACARMVEPLDESLADAIRARGQA